MQVLSGLAVPFLVPPDSRHPEAHTLVFTPGAFADVIASAGVRLQLEYDERLPVASQADGTLRAWETADGLMFTARLDETPLAAMLAAAVRSGEVQHCCVVGQYDTVAVDLETGQHMGIARVRSLTINLLCRSLQSRPTIPGTWLRVESI
jgi:HK97 family phage prohead protease